MGTVGYVMLIVTLFSNGQVERTEPVSTELYQTQYECEADIKFQESRFHLADNQQIVCGEVYRDQ